MPITYVTFDTRLKQLQRSTI